MLPGLEDQLHLELVLAAASQTQAARPARRADGDADSQQQGGLALVVLAEDTVEAAAEGDVDLLEAAEITEVEGNQHGCFSTELRPASQILNWNAAYTYL